MPRCKAVLDTGEHCVTAFGQRVFHSSPDDTARLCRVTWRFILCVFVCVCVYFLLSRRPVCRVLFPTGGLYLFMSHSRRSLSSRRLPAAKVSRQFLPCPCSALIFLDVQLRQTGSCQQSTPEDASNLKEQRNKRSSRSLRVCHTHRHTRGRAHARRVVSYHNYFSFSFLTLIYDHTSHNFHQPKPCERHGNGTIALDALGFTGWRKEPERRTGTGCSSARVIAGHRLTSRVTAHVTTGNTELGALQQIAECLRLRRICALNCLRFGKDLEGPSVTTECA